MKHFEDFEREARQYPKILERYQKKKTVFRDPNFHPNTNIKEPKVEFNEKEHVWERIDKYFTAPLFKKEAISEDGIQQGELGTCYFIAALCRIAKQPELVEQLFDTRTRSKNKKGKKNNGEFVDTINLKCGAVVVYFHAFGRITPVLIDTLIPFKRGTRRPRFVHPADIKYSPWFCLVEKAFAKLHGSYSLIIGGALSSAIYHLFGYFPCYKKISDMLKKREQKLKDKQEQGKSTKPIKFDKNEYLFSELMQWQHENAVLGADITLGNLQDGVTEDEVIDNGLVIGHAYSILKVRREQNKNFICLRNPWGDHEWLGDWSDTSPLWTPELKKALGVHSKDDGTFWMIDRDFFRYFSSFDVAKPVNPEYHNKSFMTKLVPGHHDGHPLDSREADLEHHQTFVFRLKEDIFKNKSEEEDNKGKKSKKKKAEKVDDVKVYIRIEKRSPLFDSSTDTIIDKKRYAMYIVYSDGKRLEFDQICYYSRYSLSTSSRFFRSTIHVENNKAFVIVFHRLDKCDLTEECYVQFSCKYDYDLYDYDYPNEPFKEDEKFGIVFNNKSKRYSNIAKKIKVKKIGGKEIPAFDSCATMDFNDTAYKHLIYNNDSEDSDLTYEYSITEIGESDTGKKKGKNKNETNKSSTKELKKIQRMEREIEEEKKSLNEEKKKMNEEKKRMMQQQKEIEKENEKLEKEKKLLEEEKKKSLSNSNNYIQKVRNIENKSEYEEEEEETNKKVFERKVILDNESDDNQNNQRKRNLARKFSRDLQYESDDTISKSESDNSESQPKNSNRQANRKQNIPKRRTEKYDDSNDSESQPRKTNRQNNRKQIISKKDEDLYSSDYESDDSRNRYNDKQSKSNNQSYNRRNIICLETGSDSSSTISESRSKPTIKRTDNSSPSKKSIQISNSDSSVSDSENTNRPIKQGTQPRRNKTKSATANQRRIIQISDSSEEESDSEDSRTTKNPTNNRNKPRRNQSKPATTNRSKIIRRSDSDSSEEESESENPRTSKMNTRNQPRKNQSKPATTNRKRIIQRSDSDSSEEESESENLISNKMNTRNQPRNNRRVASPRNKQISSSDSDSESDKPRNRNLAKRNQKRMNQRKVYDSDDSSSDDPNSSPKRKKAASAKANTRNKLRKPNTTNKNKTQRTKANKKTIESDYTESDSESSQKIKLNKRRPISKKKVSESDYDESTSDSIARTGNNRVKNQRKKTRQAKNANRMNSDSDSERNLRNIRRRPNTRRVSRK